MLLSKTPSRKDLREGAVCTRLDYYTETPNPTRIESCHTPSPTYGAHFTGFRLSIDHLSDRDGQIRGNGS